MKHIVSCSLGKDSVAMLLMMIEKGMQIDEIVWANTSLEFPENYDYLKKLEEYIGRKLIVVKPQTTFNTWFYKTFSRGKFANTARIHGFPFVLTAGWCCREFKVKPLVKSYNLIDGEKIVYIGYAYDERDRVMNNMKNITFRYPLIEWKVTEAECRDYLNKKLMLNPLYDRFNRIGCWLCPKQSLHSLKSLWRYYPAMWSQLKKYEADSPHGFRIKETLIQLEEKWVKQDEFDKAQMKLEV